MNRLMMPPTMSNTPHCYRCMKREVDSPGLLCGYCGRIAPRKRGVKLEDWTLEQLIETQNDGSVPEGVNRWERNEVPYDPNWF